MNIRVSAVPAGAILVAATLGLSLLLGGCSSPGGGSASAPTPTLTSGAGLTPAVSTPPASVRGSPSPPPPATTEGEIKVTLKNNTFPEEIRVKVGAKVVFVITNEGDEAHSFEFPDFKVYKEIEPGETVRIEWVVPNKKGKWDMGCFLTDPPEVHDGMEGTLIIE